MSVFTLMLMISKITPHFIYPLRVQRKNVWKDFNSTLVTYELAWIRVNFLNINNDKTEFLVTGTRQQLALVGKLEVLVGGDSITSSHYVSNLGYYMDSELKNGTCINRVISGCFHLLKQLSKV